NILNDATSVNNVFFHWQERDRSPAFFQSLLFAPQTGVDHGEHAQRGSVVGLRLHLFLLFRPSPFTSRVRACLVLAHSPQQAFTKAAAQKICAAPQRVIAAESDERTLGRSRVAIGQCPDKPDIRRWSNGARPLLEDCINRLVERPSVCFPEEIQLSPRGTRFDVVGHNSERPIQRNNRLAITPQPLITKRDLLQSIEVTRVKLRPSLCAAQSFLLMAATTQNVAC